MTDTTESPLRWKLWEEKRPTDTKAAYRWRLPARKILGMVLQPEWTDKLHCVGMGYSENEWWPGGSHWDGYVRSVPKGLEWRLAAEGETEVVYHGLALLPSPFSGLLPKVEPKTRYIGAGPWEVEAFNLKSYLVTSYGWTDAQKMQDAWNTRATPKAVSGEVERLKGEIITLCARDMGDEAAWVIDLAVRASRLAALSPVDTDNGGEAAKFEREERYIVIKRKHLDQFKEERLRDFLRTNEIGTVGCVVVESDWPEYETVWSMIEARCTGATPKPASDNIGGAVPEGYVLASVEPTEVMLTEGVLALRDAKAMDSHRERDAAAILYRAMLAASPSPQGKPSLDGESGK